MSIQNELLELLTSVLTRAPYDLNPQEVLLEEPKNSEYGDYATNAALRLTKTLRQSPKVIAAELAAQIAQKTNKYTFQEINGFLNIKIQDENLFTELSNIKKKLELKTGKGQKVLLEYVSANPTGPLHIGHGRWAVIGDILSRVLQTVGYQVTKEFYVNDAGNQINNFINSVQAVKTGKPIPEDGYHGAYVKDLAKSNQDPVQQILAQQKAVLASLSVDFDNWYSEKKLHASGEIDKALTKLRKKGALYEQDGALWFKTTDFGDDKDRVLIRSNGEKTYFTADIAYHLDKLERGFTKLINIWGADHHGYISRVQAALKALTGKDKTGLEVILGQLVNLFRAGEPVRMSKRTGEMITLEEVITEIGVDATRYFLAMRSPDSMLDFDLELAKKQTNDNPVYYVQYAHARICSILRQEEALQNKTKPVFLPLEKSERALILKMLRLPEEIENISKHFGIHRLCLYAEDLARMFHAFYHECRVISNDTQLTANRLQVIKAMKAVLEIVLGLLAVSAPEKM